MATYGNTDTTAVWQQYASYGGAFICLPTDDLPSNATVDSINVYTYYTGGTSYFKFAIWNESKTLVANSLSSEITVSNSSAAWKTFNYSTKPTLTAGQRYYIGLIHSNTSALRIIYQTSTGEGGYDISKTFNYTSGENLGTLSNTNRRMAFYIDYTASTPSGPSLKIEGITPGKLEYTNWSSLSDVF